MKNVNIMGVHQFLVEQEPQKNNIYGQLPEKGAWQKIGRVFLRGLIP